MHRGYTKRWRKRWDKGYHEDPLLWVMMDYFIDFANWQDNEFPFFWRGALVEMVMVKRGQCFFTYQGLANFLNGPLNPVSRKMVKRRTSILEKIEFLGHDPGRQYQIVTVLNYNKYNPIQEQEGRDQGRDRAVIGTRQGRDRNTPKEYKERKEKDFPDYQTIVKEAISYLNKQAGVNFNPTTYATETMMVDRINEGAILDDFKAVIKKKTSQWLNDEKMAGNLAPTTLFASDKFEKYLQEANRNGSGKKPKTQKLTTTQLMGMGFDILDKFGRDKFNEFCLQNKLSEDDINVIQDKHHRESANN